MFSKIYQTYKAGVFLTNILIDYQYLFSSSIDLSRVANKIILTSYLDHPDVFNGEKYEDKLRMEIIAISAIALHILSKETNQEEKRIYTLIVDEYTKMLSCGNFLAELNMGESRAFSDVFFNVIENSKYIQ